MKKNTYFVMSLSGLAIVSMAILPAEPVQAFPFLSSWHLPASGETQGSNKNRAGAAGLYGTGGPFEKKIECAHCHIDAEGKIGVDFQVQPAFGTSGNDKVYSPGTTYAITVNMTGEHKGLNNTDQNGNAKPEWNLNGFAMSFEDPSGNIMGKITTDNGLGPVGYQDAACPPNAPATDPSGTTYAYGDCHAVLFIPVTQITSWTFSWTAPAAGTGEVKAWYGVVDGDQHGSSSLGDDVVQGHLKLIEGS